MNIRDYLEKTGISPGVFAKRCGMSYQQLWMIATKQRMPTLIQAYSIVTYTDGEVDYSDMINDNVEDNIQEDLEKNPLTLTQAIFLVNYINKDLSLSDLIPENVRKKIADKISVFKK